MEIMEIMDIMQMKIMKIMEITIQVQRGVPGMVKSSVNKINNITKKILALPLPFAIATSLIK